LRSKSSQFTRKRKNRYGFIKTKRLGSIHTNREQYWEEFSDYWYTGSKDPLRGGGSRFNFTFKFKDVSTISQEILICAAERENDRTFVSSWVKVGRPLTKPLVEIVPCDESSFRRGEAPYVARMRARRPACFRCRSFAYPDARLRFYFKGRILNRSPRIHLDSHQNLADGGVTELTLTIWSVSAEDDGEYKCEASNVVGEAHVIMEGRVNGVNHG
jgi:hypothetical protein